MNSSPKIKEKKKAVKHNGLYIYIRIFSKDCIIAFNYMYCMVKHYKIKKMCENFETKTSQSQILQIHRI